MLQVCSHFTRCTLRQAHYLRGRKIGGLRGAWYPDREGDWGIEGERRPTPAVNLISGKPFDALIASCYFTLVNQCRQREQLMPTAVLTVLIDSSRRRLKFAR